MYQTKHMSKPDYSPADACRIQGTLTFAHLKLEALRGTPVAEPPLEAAARHPGLERQLFVHSANIGIFRSLLARALGDEQRAVVANLLSAEERALERCSAAARTGKNGGAG